MKTLGKSVAGVLESITTVGAMTGAAMICLVSIIVVYEVVVRAMGEPTIWVNEVSVYLFLWSAFLGLALTQRRGEHFRVTILTDHFSQKTQDILQLASTVIGAAFCAIMLWKGLEMTLGDYAMGRLSPTLLHFPIFLLRLAIPLGSSILLAELLRYILELSARIRSGAN